MMCFLDSSGFSEAEGGESEEETSMVGPFFILVDCVLRGVACERLNGMAGWRVVVAGIRRI